MTDGETLALVEGDVVEHRGYPGLRMVVLAAPRLGWPDYVKPGPPVLVRFAVSSVVAGPGDAEIYLSGAYLVRPGDDDDEEQDPSPMGPLSALNRPSEQDESVDEGDVLPLFPEVA